MLTFDTMFLSEVQASTSEPTSGSSHDKSNKGVFSDSTCNQINAKLLCHISLYIICLVICL